MRKPCCNQLEDLLNLVSFSPWVKDKSYLKFWENDFVFFKKGLFLNVYQYPKVMPSHFKIQFCPFCGSRIEYIKKGNKKTERSQEVKTIDSNESLFKEIEIRN